MLPWERWSIVLMLYMQPTCVEKALGLNLKEPLLSLRTTEIKNLYPTCITPQRKKILLSFSVQNSL